MLSMESDMPTSPTKSESEPKLNIRKMLKLVEHVRSECLLPGGHQWQRDKQCWITSLSMLTGIDVNLFPHDDEEGQKGILPFVWGSEKNDDGWRHLWMDPDSYTNWKILLEDNGYHLENTAIKPDAPTYIVSLFNLERTAAHAAVVENGAVVDPAFPFDLGMELQEYLKTSGYVVVDYVTVTKLKGKGIDNAFAKAYSMVRRLVRLGRSNHPNHTTGLRSR